jgi:uncharacterized membrane protein (UPF0127 family)
MFNAAALALALVASPSPSPQPTPQHLPTISVIAPNATLTLQVARTGAQEETGLMWVTALPPHTGMIFLFSMEQPQSFWMKDTLIPLDMVFVGGDDIVRHVFTNVAVVAPTLPDAKIPLETANGKYVIELPAGEAALDGIVEGTKLNVSAVLRQAQHDTAVSP